jgi:hypothetical protein
MCHSVIGSRGVREGIMAFLGRWITMDCKGVLYWIFPSEEIAFDSTLESQVF